MISIAWALSPIHVCLNSLSIYEPPTLTFIYRSSVFTFQRAVLSLQSKILSVIFTHLYLKMGHTNVLIFLWKVHCPHWMQLYLASEQNAMSRLTDVLGLVNLHDDFVWLIPPLLSNETSSNKSQSLLSPPSCLLGAFFFPHLFAWLSVIQFCPWQFHHILFSYICFHAVLLCSCSLCFSVLNASHCSRKTTV